MANTSATAPRKPGNLSKLKSTSKMHPSWPIKRDSAHTLGKSEEGNLLDRRGENQHDNSD